VTAGPRFNFPNGGLVGDNPASFRPYAIFDEAGLGWDQYFVAGAKRICRRRITGQRQRSGGNWLVEYRRLYRPAGCRIAIEYSVYP
jgi:hypothetical protein